MRKCAAGSAARRPSGVCGPCRNRPYDIIESKEAEPTLDWKNFFRLAAHTQLMPVLESGEETLVGGQAVMEGVMMRTPHAYCVAVRKLDGSFATEQYPLERLSEKRPIWKLPVLRGVGTLGQAMWLGVKALRFSADVATADAAAAEGKPANSGGKPAGEIPGWAMALNLIFSFVFFIALYKFVPLVLTEWVKRSVPSLENAILFNLTDGVIRLVIFLGFLWTISRWKDIHRVFEYHGGEHRTVFCFEANQPLTVENAQKFVTWHPRCGTSFLLVVMMVSIAVYAVIPAPTFAAKMAVRVLALPLITGLSYEAIRFAAKRRASLMATLVAPGLWLQRITTQPPSDDQTATAIRALEGALEIEKQNGGELVIA